MGGLGSLGGHVGGILAPKVIFEGLLDAGGHPSEPKLGANFGLERHFGGCREPWRACWGHLGPKGDFFGFCVGGRPSK